MVFRSSGEYPECGVILHAVFFAKNLYKMTINQTGKDVGLEIGLQNFKV